MFKNIGRGPVSRLIFIIFLAALHGHSLAQQNNNDKTDANIADDEEITADTTALSPGDLPITGSFPVIDTLNNQGSNSDITTTINYSAEDSIITDVLSQKVFLYGDAKIDYGEIKLEAEQIEIDYVNNTLTAAYITDSTGRKVGLPIFTDGPEKYTTTNIRYNFKTKKAYITGIVTQQGEAFMHGDTVKKNDQNELFVKNAKYTTCNLEHPHFHIQSNKLKLIPKNKMISGPFKLHFSDIPTPLGLPFGMFPVPKRRASGILFPTYGEQRARGFFLRDGGYFFAISDYVNLEVRGEIYSKGGHGLSAGSNYKKRYAYSGQLDFRYNKFLTGEEEDSIATNDFWLKWSHTPESRGTSRFSASVNGGTSTYNRNNVLDVTRNVTANFNSNVSYSKSFSGTPFNMSLSARHNQNVATNQVDVTLPDLAFNMNRVYPFSGAGGTGSKWYERINIGWNFNLSNRVTNRTNLTAADGTDSIAPFNFSTIGTLLENAQNGARHTVPLSTSISLFKYFTISPTINFTEYWYLQELTHRYDEELDAIVADTINGFSRAGEYSIGAGLTTRLYGTVNFGADSKVQAIRHVLTPTVNFSYRPDFSDPGFGIYEEVTNPNTGEVTRVSKFDGPGFIFGDPSPGRSGTVGLTLANTVEMKVKPKSDTADVAKKVMLLENFSVQGSYNFAADSFNLSNFTLALRTRLFNRKLNVNLASTIDPYVYRLDTSFVNTTTEAVTVRQTRLDRYKWDAGQGLGQISSARLTLSTNLNPNSFERQAASLPDRDADPVRQGQIDYIRANPEQFVDFSIPWSFRASYNVSYSKTGFQEANIVQTLTFSGDVSLSEKWKVGFQSGYDFESKDLTQTSLNIARDLHCWELNFYWVPFGVLTSYNLTVQVKSSVLQDLKLNRRRAWTDF